MYPDSSYCRDKVSRAAGRRAVGSVFCSPFIKFTVTSKLHFHYRDSYVIGFYRDGTPCVRLPGLAKNSPTRTRTATQLNRRAVICKVLNPRQLDRADIHPTYNSIRLIISIIIPRLLTCKQEFGSRHHDTRRCCQTHVFLPTLASPDRQLVEVLYQIEL